MSMVPLEDAEQHQLVERAHAPLAGVEQAEVADSRVDAAVVDVRGEGVDVGGERHAGRPTSVSEEITSSGSRSTSRWASSTNGAGAT
jgi:hypothetical protein